MDTVHSNHLASPMPTRKVDRRLVYTIAFSLEHVRAIRDCGNYERIDVNDTWSHALSIRRMECLRTAAILAIVAIAGLLILAIFRRMPTPTFDELYRLMRRVPRGQVATYGQIAALAGYPRHARYVGLSLRKLTPCDDDVPWHRIVNGSGRISRRGIEGWDDLQRRLLESENVEFDREGRIDLNRYRWQETA